MGWAGISLVLAVWGLGCVWVCHRLGRGFSDPSWRLVAQLLAMALLLPLPLVDELIAGPQLLALCRDRAQLVVHLPQALTRPAGTLVHRALKPEPIEGVGVPVHVQPWWLVEPALGLVVASYDWVEARGGWLARWARGENAAPLSFRGRCDPAGLPERLGPHQPVAGVGLAQQ